MGAGRLKPSSPYDHGRQIRLQPPWPTPEETPPPPGAVAPSSFLCPIHLDIMADPVTLHTGITYDRTSIETWLTTDGHNTCPVTNQTLCYQSLIPNHALRRTILSWCEAHPWPRPPKPVNLTELATLLHGLLRNSPRGRHTDSKDPESSLHRLATVLPHLEEEQKQTLFRDPNLSNASLASHLSFLLSSGIRSSFDTRVNAAEILHILCELDLSHVTAHPDAIAGLTNLLNDDGSRTEDVTSLLKCLFSLCRHNAKNRVEAVECRAVPILLKLMIPGTGTPNSQMELCCGILESLANCAEGREAIRDHPAGVATVVESLLGVSDVATGYAIGALWGVVALAADRRSVMGVAVQAGVLNMLLMVMSSECSAKAKGLAKEMLKMVNEECRSCGPRGDARTVYYVAAAEVGLLPRRHQSSKKS